jgi:N-acetylneuraminic acid mutarotase
VTNLNGASIVSGTVGNTQLASGAAVANLQASGQSGVASGGVILSTNAVSPSLINAGYQKIGQTGIGELWAAQGNSSLLSPRYYHSAIWAGNEWIVWGGQNGSTYYGDGARYSPASNTWTRVSTNGAPSPRRSHVAFWTGSEMIIWGGLSPLEGFANNGARYNPATDSWTPIASVGAPLGCYYPAAAWCGNEMIIWGGQINGTPTYANDGARYNPQTDTWTVVPTNGAPSARYVLPAVWTGTEMIVWGGVSYTPGYVSYTYFGNGARFNPTTNGWASVQTTGAPVGRSAHTAVWTGRDMIIWCGYSSGGALGSGAIYNSATNGWTSLPTTGAPAPRNDHTAVWTGTEMLVWGGGLNGSVAFNDGARYNPALGGWSPITASSAPAARYAHTAVWTGFSMVIFGGAAPATTTHFFNDTYDYQPPSTMYLYIKP